MSDDLAPAVTAEEAEAAAHFDAIIGAETPQETPAQEKPPAESAPAETPAEPPQERDYEAEARSMGWKPKEEWSGDPDKHRDAQTFVELADSDPAVLRKRYTDLKAQNEDFQKRITATTKAEIERVRAESERQHQDEINRLKSERDGLISQYRNDPQAIRQINDNYEQAAASIPKPLAPEAAQWIADRPQFKTDQVFKATAMATLDQIQFKDMPKASLGEVFQELDRRLQGRFPEVYVTAVQANEVPAAPAIPANGAPPAGSRTIDGARGVPRNANSYASLPPEAKAMWQRLKDEGIAPKQEDFAKDYNDQ